MPSLSVQYFVPAGPAPVYEFVTGYPVSGEPGIAVLEEKYGKFLRRGPGTLTFLEDLGAGVQWECSFDPPRSRSMRALESGWSDRHDHFEPVHGGTLWTVTWELKAGGISSIVQRLTFILLTKRRFSDRVAAPVIAHFTRRPDQE